MKIEVITITPEMAKNWLQKNTNNRKVRRDHVMRIAKAIVASKWKMTGDPIRFSTERLIDGQHRLLAIVEAGVPVSSVVMFDVPDEAFDYIDQNNKRTTADVIASHGIAYATTCSAMYKILLAYEKGGAVLHLQKAEIASSAEIAININESHIKSAAFGKHLEISGVCPASLISTWHFLTVQIDAALASAFWTSVGTGKVIEGLATMNATLLRDRLLTHAAASKRMTVEHKFTWAVRAWNAERASINLAANGLKFVAGDPIPRFE